MKKIIKILVVFVIGMLMFSKTALAEEKNEVTLNFKGGTIHDGYVEYSKIGKLQLFKGDELVTNISNYMTVDLNKAEYKFVIEEIENTSVSGANMPIKLNINNWYYPITTSILEETKSTFKLESSKFSGTLDVKLVRTITAINTKVENVYNDISSKGVIDLTNEQEYVIDFSKTDELTEGLKSFADLDKTLYYKRDNNGLLLTDNVSIAVIKIVGNRSENKAILTAVNVGTKKSEVFKGLHTKYIGSKLTFTGSNGGILNEIRTDYYTRCIYEFTSQYVKEEVNPEEHKFLEGENQTYTKDESKNATFRIDADYSLFTNKVYVDDNLLDIESYESKEGSTIITLKDSYLKTLLIGEHTLKVVFSDGITSKTKFIIKEKDKSEIKKDTINTIEETKSNGNSLNPKTGDNITTYITLFIISVLGIVASVITNNKKKREN